MKKSRLVRVTPNLYNLIEAIRLLQSNDEGRDISFIDASEKTYQKFIEFAEWDTIGLKIIKEVNKVRCNKKLM